MAEDSPNFAKDMNVETLEAKWTWDRINPNKLTLKHIVLELLKTKDKVKNLKASREEQYIIYRKNYLNDRVFLIRDHNPEWSGTRFSSPETVNSNSISSKMSFSNEGEIKIFLEKSEGRQLSCQNNDQRQFFMKKGNEKGRDS